MGLPRILKKILPDNLVYQLELNALYKVINSKMSVEEWHKKGKPLPPPDAVKHSIIEAYAKKSGASILIETGTFLGDTAFAMKEVFTSIYTIELDQKLFLRATKRFQPYNHIQVVQGNSAERLADVLKGIPADATCLFWLDGHYSGNVTGKGEHNTPITDEIKAIYQHSAKHTLLIDDARLFAQEKDGYPSFATLQQQIKAYQPEAEFEVETDIIRIMPA